MIGDYGFVTNKLSIATKFLKSFSAYLMPTCTIPPAVVAGSHLIMTANSGLNLDSHQGTIYTNQK